MTGAVSYVVEDIGEYACAVLTTILSREVTYWRAELVVEAIGDLGIVETGLALSTVSVSVTRSATYTYSAIRLTSEARLTEGRCGLVEDIARLTCPYDESLVLSSNFCEVSDTERDVLDA